MARKKKYNKKAFNNLTPEEIRIAEERYKREQEKKRRTWSFIWGVVLYILCTTILVAVILSVSLLCMNEPIVDYILNETASDILIAMSCAILSGIMYFYFYFESKKYITKPRKILEIFTLLTVSIALTIVIGSFINPIARPIALLALITVTLLGRREAIFINIIYALIMFILDSFTSLTSLTASEGYIFLISTFCTGMVAIFFTPRIKTRFESVLISFILIIPSLIIITLLDLVANGFSNYMNLLYSSLGTFIAVLLYMFLLPIFERVFSELTVFRLRELTSDQHKLIKKLKTEAPGSFHHSIMVSQLAEECAQAIGEDSELTRAVSYFHDVGKLKNPQYFTENQTGINFHDQISPELSANLIKEHVTLGHQLVEKSHLPKKFIDIVDQHHGTMPIKYFYAKAVRLTDKDVNMKAFCYAGPTPRSKIAAIIMICDAAEAASRSLTDRSTEKVEALVRSLIEERLDMGQFEDCAITMGELTTIKITIVNQLTGVYHTRTAYPKIKISKGD